VEFGLATPELAAAAGYVPIAVAEQCFRPPDYYHRHPPFSRAWPRVLGERVEACRLADLRGFGGLGTVK
jgi:hypothetical protein